MFGTRSSVESNTDIGTAQNLLEELPQRNGSDQEDIVSAISTTTQDAVDVDRPVNTCYQETATVAADDTVPMPEGEWFRSTTRPAMETSTAQGIHDSGLHTDTLLIDQIPETSVPVSIHDAETSCDKGRAVASDVNAAENASQLPFNFQNVVDPISYLNMDIQQETSMRKCLDLSPSKDEWIPIAEGRPNQNYATRYLPTIIHENKKTLSKFIPAFCDDPANKEIFKSLKLAEIAFDSLEKHFKEAGLSDCVVEFLKPVNHPNRMLEELQRARREIQELRGKYQASQDELHALTEKGAATDVQGKARAPITVSELAELESDRDMWRQQFQALKEQKDNLDRDRQSLEAMKESLTTRADAISAQSDRMWQRQKEQHDFFTKHHQQGDQVAEGITNKMYQELVKEHEELRSLFAQCPIQLAKAVNEKVALEQKLEVEKKRSRTTEVEELKRQLEELESEHQKSIFLKDIQEFHHDVEVVDLKMRLRELEWLRILTPEQIREAALNHALHEAEDFKGLYADSCLENARLHYELRLAQEYGLELGTIAELADRLDEMRLPETVWSPPAEWNSGFSKPTEATEKAAEAEPAAEERAEDASFVQWTDDSEIF